VLDVAVQIVNYNTADHLAACLETVDRDLDSSGVAARVLVVDNDSEDDLSALEARWSGRVEFHRSPRNVGFGAGHNLLAGMHDARTLLLLNPDTELIEPRTVARLLEALSAASDIAAVGPQLLTPERGVHPWDHGELHGFGARLAAAGGSSHHRVRHRRADVAWVSAASSLIAREHFDAVGGFDPGFFLYKEEEDLFLRIRRRGGRVVYEPSVRVLHVGSVTGVRRAHLEESVRRFRRKHVPSRVRRAVMPAAYEGWVRVSGRVRRWAGR
jgi:N-acetylglucosaminyl-diphospho-decaprenol L-rhamnosyltransferase